jgi:hypothetical protein
MPLSREQYKLEIINFQRYLSDKIELYFKHLSKEEKVEKVENFFSKLESVTNNDF